MESHRNPLPMNASVDIRGKITFNSHPDIKHGIISELNSLQTLDLSNLEIEKNDAEMLFFALSLSNIKQLIISNTLIQSAGGYDYQGIQNLACVITPESKDAG